MTKMSAALNDTLPYVVLIVDSDEEISETELSKEETNYNRDYTLKKILRQNRSLVILLLRSYMKL